MRFGGEREFLWLTPGADNRIFTIILADGDTGIRDIGQTQQELIEFDVQILDRFLDVPDFSP